MQALEEEWGAGSCRAMVLWQGWNQNLGKTGRIGVRRNVVSYHIVLLYTCTQYSGSAKVLGLDMLHNFIT